MGRALTCEREVAPTFDEITRIATTLAVSPTSFVVLTPHRTTSMLALGDGERGVALKRHEGRCVFLLELATKTSLCGLGELAPYTCKALSDTPLPAGTVATPPDPERQRRWEAMWRERIAGRRFPLTPEMALDGLLALMADAP